LKKSFLQIQLLCIFSDVKVDMILYCVDLERLFVEIRQVQAANRKFINMLNITKIVLSIVA